MKNIKVKKSGWNKVAAFAGPFWYMYRGMIAKGFILLSLAVGTLGIGIIPIWIYCAYSANKDFFDYIHRKGYYIY